MIDALHELARLHGLVPSYEDFFGRRREAPAETLLSVLEALGAPVAAPEDVPGALRAFRAERARRSLEPVAVAWDGGPIEVELRLPSGLASARAALRVDLEDGAPREWQVGLGGPAGAPEEGWVPVKLPIPSLPLGSHRLRVEVGSLSAACLVLAAPSRCWSPPEEERAWGVFLPLHALHSRRSQGSGDLGDLRDLVGWVDSAGGGLVGTLPLLPMFLDEPFEPSPYSPVSRLFWGEVHLDVTRLPEAGASPEARAALASPGFARERDALRAMPLVDWRRRLALVRRVLEPAARSFFASAPPGRREAFRRFLEERPGAEDYARFRAATEWRREPWGAWPERLREGRLEPGDYGEEAARVHLYAQWQLDEQLAEVALAARRGGPGLYLDLPLGSSPSGYDLWRERSAFVPAVSAGAPPDDFSAEGQDWGFAPLHPGRIREDGYRYLRLCLRHHLRHARALRLDHGAGLHRMFWIPRGCRPRDGVYGLYRSEELYALLALESHRHRALIVAEDLGTVPDEVRAAMDRRGVLRMYVAPFEMRPKEGDALPEVPPNMLACLNTHDMAPFPAFWEGRDLHQLRELGFVTEEALPGAVEQRRRLREALVPFLRARGLLEDNKGDALPGAREVLRALLRLLGESPAALVLVSLEDLWGETAPQNVPGTTTEHPNWVRKARHALEEFREMPEVLDALRALDRARNRRS